MYFTAMGPRGRTGAAGEDHPASPEAAGPLDIGDQRVADLLRQRQALSPPHLARQLLARRPVDLAELDWRLRSPADGAGQGQNDGPVAHSFSPSQEAMTRTMSSSPRNLALPPLPACKARHRFRGRPAALPDRRQIPQVRPRGDGDWPALVRARVASRARARSHGSPGSRIGRWISAERLQ